MEKINSPVHYAGEGMEVIDIVEAYNLDFLEGNIIKYVLRYKKKNGIEDLEKAKWYLEKLINKTNNKESITVRNTTQNE